MALSAFADKQQTARFDCPAEVPDGHFMTAFGAPDV